jgi:hypothetical protein
VEREKLDLDELKMISVPLENRYCKCIGVVPIPVDDQVKADDWIRGRGRTERACGDLGQTSKVDLRPTREREIERRDETK